MGGRPILKPAEQGEPVPGPGDVAGAERLEGAGDGFGAPMDGQGGAEQACGALENEAVLGRMVGAAQIQDRLR